MGHILMSQGNLTVLTQNPQYTNVICPTEFKSQRMLCRDKFILNLSGSKRMNSRVLFCLAFLEKGVKSIADFSALK